MRIQLNKSIQWGLLYEGNINRRTCDKDTVRGAAVKFGISKSTVHKDVTLKNGLKNRYVIPESIEIKKVFLAEKNPVVRLGLVIR